jgi:hypothetical protein
MVNKLKENFENSCNDYIKYFSEKQEIEYDLDDWIGREIGTTISFIGGQYFFNIHDIVLDVNSKCPKGLIFQWHDDTMSYNLSNKEKNYMSYQSYIMGLRYKQTK